MRFSASFTVQMSRAEWEADMAIVGYARVSTRDQNLAGQLADLKAAGCELVYREKVSGAAADRKELARLVRKATP
jgi:DNA invertase Pin-like site-specific DNA recombinase